MSSGEHLPALASLIASFDAVRKSANEPRWLASLRDEALARFRTLGVPTTRNEDWKYTSLSALGRLELDQAAGRVEGAPSLKIEASAKLIFIDGKLSKQEGTLPAGVKIQALAQALSDSKLEARISEYEQTDGIKALNTALFTDGAVVRFDRGVRLEKPIHLVYLTGAGHASFVRNIIELESGAEGRIVEEFVAPLDAARAGLTNAVTQVVLQQSAKLSHIKLQDESPSAIHLADLSSRQARDSRFESIWVSLGSIVGRNEIHARLDEENAEVSLLGVYAGTGKQQVDGHTVIDHAKPHCRSEEVYKGIMDDEAKGAFTGRIVVRKDAQKTDSRQINRNLLLSERAVADTRPQLQIHADDVKCSHGATVGRLDEEQLYYLRSRGIGQELARKLVSRAFAGDVLERIPGDELRAALGNRFDAWLAGGRS